MSSRKFIFSVFFAFTTILLTTLAYADVLYVTEEGTGDGSSWDNALGDPQEAIELATVDEAYNQVWVAAGTYRPSWHPNGGGLGEREEHFSLRNGVAVYGGFSGTESSLSQRDLENNLVIFSGDIGEPGDSSDNAYHVFYHPNGTDLDDTAILDGIKITEGNADGGRLYARGGGISNEFSSPTLSNVNISNNNAASGGGIHNYSSFPTLTNVNISDNTASNYGGGMHNRSSSPILTNVDISNNTASNYGGGMYNDDGNPRLTNVTILNNNASSGGGIYNKTSSLYLINITISNNSALEGGGIYNYFSNYILIKSCSIVNNSAHNGGGMLNYYSSPKIKNTIFWDNSASKNGDDYINSVSSSPVVSWSIFKKYYPGGENIITEDPLIEPLAENGGFTKTHAIPSDSPAYAIPESAGDGNWNDAPDTDQRGMVRATSGYRAMGAYEDTEISQAVTPKLLQIPSTSSTGDYTISWGSSETSNVTYVLEEATNENFTENLRTAYTGPRLSTTISDKSKGTYYYRVKATKEGYEDSEWRTGDHGCVVRYEETTGSLQILIEPSKAIDAGAQWRIEGTDTWYDSGETVSDIPVEAHTIEFSTVTDWRPIESIEVDVQEGEVCEGTGYYEEIDVALLGVMMLLLEDEE